MVTEQNGKQLLGTYCKWRSCSKSNYIFETAEEVLEHVFLIHIPTVVQIENSEHVVCKWNKCKTSASRGNLFKKTEWMKNHFKARHAKTAKTFKCIFQQCNISKMTSQELETHVWLHHLRKPKKETKLSVRSKTPDVAPNRIWRIVNGDVEWEPPIIVTNKTVIHYDDGPRYAYPTGCPRCNYDSDESELASDEDWMPVEYSSEEILSIPSVGPKSFIAPYAPLINTSSKIRRAKRIKTRRLQSKGDELKVSAQKSKGSFSIGKGNNVGTNVLPNGATVTEPSVKFLVRLKEEEIEGAILYDCYEEEYKNSDHIKLSVKTNERNGRRKIKELDLRKLKCRNSDSSVEQLIIEKKKETEQRKVPHRACKQRVSLSETENDLKIFGFGTEKLTKKNSVFGLSCPLSNRKRLIKESKDSGTIRTNQLKELCGKSRSCSMKKVGKCLKKMPVRSCRVLGSLEEIPFDLEVCFDLGSQV